MQEGLTPTQSNVIDSFEMASQGNAADFGDLTVSRLSSGASNGTRGITHGGNTPIASNVIDYVTIASAGNATDFGDTTVMFLKELGAQLVQQEQLRRWWITT